MGSVPLPVMEAELDAFIQAEKAKAAAGASGAAQ